MKLLSPGESHGLPCPKAGNHGWRLCLVRRQNDCRAPGYGRSGDSRGTSIHRQSRRQNRLSTIDRRIQGVWTSRHSCPVERRRFEDQSGRDRDWFRHRCRRVFQSGALRSPWSRAFPARPLLSADLLDCPCGSPYSRKGIKNSRECGYSHLSCYPISGLD
jgi:hypothetical protein